MPALHRVRGLVPRDTAHPARGLGGHAARRSRGVAAALPAVAPRPIVMHSLEATGNTSIVRLGKVVPPRCADILVKLEWENPTGSMKDRMARAVIARAEEDARPRRGDTLAESTGRSAGAALDPGWPAPG